jgi:hypothetical protein
LSESLLLVTTGSTALLVGVILGIVIKTFLGYRIMPFRHGSARSLSRDNFTTQATIEAGFELGPLRSSCMLVEGDGTRTISEDRIHIIVDSSKAHLPADLAKWRAEIAEQQESQRVIGKKHYWNGQTYAVESFTISRTELEEHPELYLRLSSSDYFTFLATQQLDRAFADGTTPRSRYIDSANPLRAPSFMASSFGTSVVVITADNKILVRQRGDHVGSRPGYWSVSADEGLSRSIDGANGRTPRLSNVAHRALLEELTLEKHECRLSLLAFTLDLAFYQWDAIFVAYLPDIDEGHLTSRLKRGALDLWEHRDQEFVPFDTYNVMNRLLSTEHNRKWMPIAPVAFYLALVYQYGREKVERAISTFEGRSQSRL